MFRALRKRQKLRREIAARLERLRDEAEAGASELRICGAILALHDEELEAATLVGDEASARTIMDEMRPLLAERTRLIAREKARDEGLRTFQKAIEEK